MVLLFVKEKRYKFNNIDSWPKQLLQILFPIIFMKVRMYQLFLCKEINEQEEMILLFLMKKNRINSARLTPGQIIAPCVCRTDFQMTRYLGIFCHNKQICSCVRRVKQGSDKLQSTVTMIINYSLSRLSALHDIMTDFAKDQALFDMSQTKKQEEFNTLI